MDFDVAIVGAGPSGSSTALHLLRHAPGMRVALIDRATLPRNKPCGGAISRSGLDVLAGIAATPALLGVDAVPIHAIRVRYRDRVSEHAEDRPLGAVVFRAPFDAALAREAARRGAKLLEGHRLTAIEAIAFGNRLSFQTSRGARTLEARVVVGADGTGSAVRRLAGFEERGRRAQLIVSETEGVPGDDVLRGGRGVLEFDLSVLDRGIDGYVWHFATTVDGRSAVSRGVYRLRGRPPDASDALRGEMHALLEARRLSRVRLEHYSERVFRGVGAPLALASGVLLVGEAAGLVDPVTGEGIAQALVSGRVAAEQLASGAPLDPERYRVAIEELHCVRHLRQSAVLSRWVYGQRGWLWADALADCPSAVAAGCDWYAERPLSLSRVARVGAAMAASFARAGVRRARG